MDPNYPEEIRKKQWENLKKNGTLTFETLHTAKDGHTFPVEVTDHYIKYNDEEYEFAFATDITKRKQVEEALIKSEKRFREFVELLPEVVFETDKNNRLIFANRKAFELFGYYPEDLDDITNMFDVIAPCDRGRAKEIFNRHLRGEDTGMVEYTGLKKDGTTFPMLVHTVLIREEGELKRTRGVVIDISERKQMENELVDSRRRLSLALEAVNLGTWDWHIPSGKVVFNDIWASTKGYEPGEIKPHIRKRCLKMKSREGQALFLRECIL